MNTSNLGHLALHLGLLACAPALAMDAKAQTAPLETQVKAAFLSKFPAYVSWPPSVFSAPDQPIRLCVIGHDPFGPVLDRTVAGQSVDMHPILVVRLEGGTATAGQCHIAFLGGTSKQSTAAMQQALLEDHILTVTDASLSPAHGIIHFELKGGKVRFHIDDAMAARSRLSINARLLGLALSVRPRTRTS